MKRFFKHWAILLLLQIAVCCGSQKALPSADVNYLSSDESTITVRAVGVGSDRELAICNAEQKVFDVLFFRGLPQSTQKQPLIGSDEASEKTKNASYFENFYGKKRYKTFVMSAIPVSDLAKIKGGQRTITVDVKVNLSALRRDLETFGVIRKFGF